jgi:uncharacterized RDD family membrane protein YckC
MDMHEDYGRGDLFQNKLLLVPASPGKRLANFVIDQLVVIAVIVLVLVILNNVDHVMGERLLGMLATPLIGNLLAAFLYSFMMSVEEALMKGKSIGKLITGTRAVMEDGSAMNGERTFLRNLIRCVPFNQFSALGAPPNPWHDRWSHTLVIDEKRSRLYGE